MLRADDEQGVVSVEEINGVTSVTMLNDYGDDAYVTRIYCYEGQLYEWFSSTEIEFAPEEGEAVCPCDGLTAELRDGLLSVSLHNGDEWTNVDVALRAS